MAQLIITRSNAYYSSGAPIYPQVPILYLPDNTSPTVSLFL